MNKNVSREEKLETVLDYVHSELVKCDRSVSWGEKQQHLDNAMRAAMDGVDAYERIVQSSSESQA